MGVGGGGVVQVRLTEKKSDFGFFSSFCKSLAYFAEGVQGSCFFFQRKLPLNYNFPIFHGEGRSNISRGSNFSQGEGVQLHIST